MRKNSLLVAAIMMILSPLAGAQSVDLAQRFDFSGVLTNPTTQAPMTGPVSLSFEILDPSGNCLLFSENFNSVPLDSQGGFALKIGSGTRAGVGVDGGLPLKTVFQNASTPRPGNPTNCNPSYVPVAGDGRKLRVYVGGTALTPDFALTPVPMATVAETLQGKVPTDFLASTGGNLTGPLLLQNYNGLRLAAASTANFVELKAPALGAPYSLSFPVDDGTPGQVLTTDGSGILSWTTTGGSGTVTSITAGSGLTGGTITGTGTLAVNAGTAPNQIVQLNGSGFLPAVNGSQLTNVSAIAIQGYSVAATAPSTGQVLTWSAGAWTPLNPVFNTVGGTTDYLFNTGGGAKLGIGTTSPFVTFQVGNGAGGSTPVGQFDGTVAVRNNSPGSPSTLFVTNVNGGLSGSAIELGGNNGGNAYPLARIVAYQPSNNVGQVGIETQSGGSFMERLRITAGGNVGIGTTAPLDLLQVEGNVSGTVGMRVLNTNNSASAMTKLMVGNDTSASAFFISTNGSTNSGGAGVSSTTLGTPSGFGPLAFQTNGVERMRIHQASGNIGIGVGNPAAKLEINSGANNANIGAIINITSVGPNTYQEFRVNGGVIGNISTSAGASILYNTTSDIRLKGGFQAVASPLKTLNEIEVSNFYYLADPEHRMDGFKAQQLYNVLPYAVVKPEKEVNDTGKINPWLADYSKVVPLVTAAVQELSAKVQQLEHENAELKARISQVDQKNAELQSIKQYLCAKDPAAPVCH